MITDFDGVIYRGASMSDFFTFLYENNAIPTSVIKKLITFSNIYRQDMYSALESWTNVCAESLRHWDVGRVREYVEHFWKENKKKIDPWTTCVLYTFGGVIISATFQEILDGFASMFNKKIDVIGTLLEVKDNRYTGKILRSLYTPGAKARYVIPYAGAMCIGMGDTLHDLGILLATGIPIAVRPDEGLMKYAIRNRWKIWK